MKLHLIGWDILCSPKSVCGLGLRKFELNNLAMLARNAWKLIENPDCLLGSVLKVKYFPKIDFLNAKCPSVCSWTWRCLHTIKEMIKPFISWIAGDGKFIDLWCDKWILNLGSATPNPLVPTDPRVKVSYFIDVESRSWNIDRLNTHFDDASVQKIISILISQFCTPYRSAWELLKNADFPLNLLTWDSEGFGPPLVANFGNFECLAVFNFLFGNQPEMFCMLGLFYILECLCTLLTVVDALILEKLLCMLWSSVLFPVIFGLWLLSSLWSSTNNLVFRNLRDNYAIVINRAKAMLLTIRLKSQNPPIPPSTYSDTWMPPTFGWIKCNVDGAFDDTTLGNGAGYYVMRDFSSKATFCASIVFNVTSAEEAEARAIWVVLKKVVELKLAHITIESDAKDLINQFSTGKFDGNARIDVIYKDIQVFASSLIGCILLFNL
ncbi:uncharacterized protein LOC113350848 [Papaver somniferum]|uniref:uncharacterized protein LOC113350848 n=1 Tax=Papaver somniferum TaxID=3469 RepID=UPI000E702963|nr:uncharacterized protein LOC113350848 [Papaver somniferum]